jgi:hypothetical protein
MTEDRYLVVVVQRSDLSVSSLGPYFGDEGAETAHQTAVEWTDTNSKAIVIGV